MVITGNLGRRYESFEKDNAFDRSMFASLNGI